MRGRARRVGAAQGRPRAGREPRLPSAGSLAGLRKLVEHSVDCSRFTTDPETVAIRSIDCLPAVEGDHKAWGVRERGICGEPGGAHRAHGLVRLDTVHDMAAFQNREKAAQPAEIKEHGRIRATRSKVLIGTGIAVETNDAASRHGLYQQRFLHLNCRSGFTARRGTTWRRRRWRAAAPARATRRRLRVEHVSPGRALDLVRLRTHRTRRQPS
ncbi:hypothetical protein [Streptomyces albireticuli]|uniref:Uncharacterized protein n=1 Tax=Streptomyces albireticuli TaxID=1940 RepID=A0A2A2DFT8_9ACTN|nr:hypothetical protein [Streptomyces albireticuli]MCD9194332.1 hypothetical protein [Streptomyces albireticuli]PAU50279.1 hypothetical protein CK936_03435 [Streptomyces albireticuli]